MRIPALIFSLIGFYGLLMVTNVTVYHFMPSSSAQEGGLIEAGLGLIVGGIASLIAGLFALLHLRRARGSQLSRLLLAWCCLIAFGFIVVLLHMMLDYRHAQAA